jgi:hypothetical protein
VSIVTDTGPIKRSEEEQNEMIATMPKKAIRTEAESRSPRTGVVNAAKMQAFIVELTDLLNQAKSISPMFETVPDGGELIVDGVGLADRGVVNCGVFLDNVRTAFRRRRYSR